MLYKFGRGWSGAGLACLLAMGMAAPGFGQGIFRQNLVANPGAEAGSGMSGNDQDAVKDVPGWTLSGGLTVAKYDGTNFIGSSDYGPAERGANYFAGGPGGGKTTASQSIDLSGAAAEIDAGTVRFYLSAYLGGSSQVDFRGGVRATFKDASGKVLLTGLLKGPTGDEIYFSAALVSRATSGFLPPNTRSVDVVIDMTGTDEAFNPNAADNLSLMLNVESLMGSNLIVNGNAETPNDALGNIGNSTPVVGWNTTPKLYTTTYDDARLGPADQGPSDRGSYLFIGAGGGTGTEFSQTVDVTLVKDLIDAGGVKFGFSAYLGGYQDSIDTAAAKAEFLDDAGGKLGEALLTTVTLEDRGGAGGMLLREANGTMPVATRGVRLTVTFSGTTDPAESYRFGYALADSIVFGMAAPAADLHIKDKGIVNAASGQAGAVAAGEIVNVLTTGVDLTSVVRMQLNKDGKVSTELGGVKLYFDGTQAPLLYVNSSEVRGIVPFDVDKKSSVEVRLEYKGVKSNTVTTVVAPTSPAVFTQEGTPKGAGLVYDAGWSLVSAGNPAAKGSTVTVIWTGGGQTNPDGVDGRIETQSLPKPKAAVTAKIGGQTARVVFAGAVPFSWAGLLMAQIEVPSSVTAGNALEVLVTAGAATSPSGVTVAVK